MAKPTVPSPTKIAIALTVSASRLAASRTSRGVTRGPRRRCADDIINPLGIKGVGEIGIVGVAAAIANAIYHATGKRVRDLPITLDKLQS